MSLQTDRIFYAALAADSTIMAAVENRVYNTAIPLPEQDADNVPAPYIIISFEGMQNDDQTKDDSYEGDEDIVTISMSICHTTRGALATLADQVRAAIPDFFCTYEYDEESGEEDLTELLPIDYTLTAGPIIYDEFKPAYEITLNYRCITNA